MKSIGTLLEERTDEIYNLFTPVEGNVCFYYGRIRNGKTYSATSDILDLLKRGEVVYANWVIDFSEFDERNDFKTVFLKFIFGKKYFFKYLGDNFHYFSPDLSKEKQIALLGNLVGVHIFIDEGQWIFNSHIKNQDDETRKLILHNGHYCRSLNIISQRPSNVMLDMRSQINIWYKCEKKLSFPLLFERTTYEDMKDGLPDEGDEERNTSSGHKVYLADKRIMRAYSTHAMRAENAVLPTPAYEVYLTTTLQRLMLVAQFLPFVGRFFRPTRAKDTS